MASESKFTWNNLKIKTKILLPMLVLFSLNLPQACWQKARNTPLRFWKVSDSEKQNNFVYTGVNSLGLIELGA